MAIFNWFFVLLKKLCLSGNLLKSIKIYAWLVMGKLFRLKLPTLTYWVKGILYLYSLYWAYINFFKRILLTYRIINFFICRRVKFFIYCLLKRIRFFSNNLRIVVIRSKWIRHKFAIFSLFLSLSIKGVGMLTFS